MKTLIKNATVWQADNSFIYDTCVLICDGIIAKVGMNISDEKFDSIIDANGSYLIPGLVDVHTHGRVGYDFNTATEEQMLTLKDSYIKSGVTSVFPTLASDTVQGWKESVSNIASCGFDGIHLEGRYLSEKRRGAHPPHLLALPDFDEVEDVIGCVDMPIHLSLAPEICGGIEFIKRAKDRGMTLGIAHTSASAEKAREALLAGAISFTHLFNGMEPMHHRDGGVVCEALLSGAYCELIADGLHICPDMLKLAYKCVGKDKTVLITDSMAGAGMQDGLYSIAGQSVRVVDGRALTLDGALAGSTLDLLTAMKNFISLAGVPLEDAVACATKNPACMVGIYDRVGSIDEGKVANMLLLDRELNLQFVIYDGEIFD